MRRVVVALLIAGLAVPLAAQDDDPIEAVALGDSITEGDAPFDEEDRGGYPQRLQRLLRRGGLDGAIVHNRGRGGETTVDMLARFGGELPGRDIFLLLGGTNDVDRIINGRLTFDDTIDNLEFMIRTALDSGVRAILGTLPPRRPDARSDRTNTTTYELVLRIRELVRSRPAWELFDPWHAFPNRQPSTFALYYYPGSDPIGHPNAAGFDRLAETVAGVILEGDSQPPVEGRFRSPGAVEEVDRRTDYDIDLFDFGGAGLFLPSATIVLNGEPIETMVTGNRRMARLFAEGDRQRRCKVVLSVRAEDRAEPPNELDLFLITYASADGELIAGDGTGDCRVDGRDLARFGPTFGKSREEPGFDEEFDFVEDGVIDGEDFARLAANFGEGEL